MEFDAFTGGVEPGGLRTKNQIRILICYLLSSVDAPLSRQDIIGIMPVSYTHLDVYKRQPLYRGKRHRYSRW